MPIAERQRQSPTRVSNILNPNRHIMFVPFDNIQVPPPSHEEPPSDLPTPPAQVEIKPPSEEILTLLNLREGVQVPTPWKASLSPFLSYLGLNRKTQENSIRTEWKLCDLRLPGQIPLWNGQMDATLWAVTPHVATRLAFGGYAERNDPTHPESLFAGTNGQIPMAADGSLKALLEYQAHPGKLADMGKTIAARRTQLDEIITELAGRGLGERSKDDIIKLTNFRNKAADELRAFERERDVLAAKPVEKPRFKESLTKIQTEGIINTLAVIGFEAQRLARGADRSRLLNEVFSMGADYLRVVSHGTLFGGLDQHKVHTKQPKLQRIGKRLPGFFHKGIKLHQLDRTPPTVISINGKDFPVPPIIWEDPERWNFVKFDERESDYVQGLRKKQGRLGHQQEEYLKKNLSEGANWSVYADLYNFAQNPTQETYFDCRLSLAVHELGLQNFLAQCQERCHDVSWERWSQQEKKRKFAEIKSAFGGDWNEQIASAIDQHLEKSLQNYGQRLHVLKKNAQTYQEELLEIQKTIKEFQDKLSATLFTEKNYQSQTITTGQGTQTQGLDLSVNLIQQGLSIPHLGDDTAAAYAEMLLLKSKLSNTPTAIVVNKPEELSALERAADTVYTLQQIGKTIKTIAENQEPGQTLCTYLSGIANLCQALRWSRKCDSTLPAFDREAFPLSQESSLGREMLEEMATWYGYQLSPKDITQLMTVVYTNSGRTELLTRADLKQLMAWTWRYLTEPEFGHQLEATLYEQSAEPKNPFQDVVIGAVLNQLLHDWYRVSEPVQVEFSRILDYIFQRQGDILPFQYWMLTNFMLEYAQNMKYQGVPGYEIYDKPRGILNPDARLEKNDRPKALDRKTAARKARDQRESWGITDGKLGDAMAVARALHENKVIPHLSEEQIRDIVTSPAKLYQLIMTPGSQIQELIQELSNLQNTLVIAPHAQGKTKIIELITQTLYFDVNHLMLALTPEDIKSGSYIEGEVINETLDNAVQNIIQVFKDIHQKEISIEDAVAIGQVAFMFILDETQKILGDTAVQESGEGDNGLEKSQDKLETLKKLIDGSFNLVILKYRDGQGNLVNRMHNGGIIQFNTCNTRLLGFAGMERVLIEKAQKAALKRLEAANKNIYATYEDIPWLELEVGDFMSAIVGSHGSRFTRKVIMEAIKEGIEVIWKSRALPYSPQNVLANGILVGGYYNRLYNQDIRADIVRKLTSQGKTKAAALKQAESILDKVEEQIEFQINIGNSSDGRDDPGITALVMEMIEEGKQHTKARTYDLRVLETIVATVEGYIAFGREEDRGDGKQLYLIPSVAESLGQALEVRDQLIAKLVAGHSLTNGDKKIIKLTITLEDFELALKRRSLYQTQASAPERDWSPQGSTFSFVNIPIPED